jgi:hypothetical protein
MIASDSDNELLGSMKGRELLYYLSNYKLLKTESATWNWKWIRCPIAEPCKCGNKPSAYIKGEKCIHKLSGYQLLTKDLAPCIRMVENKDITALSVQETSCPQHKSTTEYMPHTFQLLLLQAMSACSCSCPILVSWMAVGDTEQYREMGLSSSASV